MNRANEAGMRPDGGRYQQISCRMHLAEKKPAAQQRDLVWSLFAGRGQSDTTSPVVG
ncbi:hypothetical protein LAB1_34750 [Roseibium sp. LAB1]